MRAESAYQGCARRFGVAHKDQVFADFRDDPDWHALRAQFEVPLSAEVFMMSATDYSKLK